MKPPSIFLVWDARLVGGISCHFIREAGVPKVSLADWLKDALLQPESRECFQRLLSQGWIDSVRHLYPDERVYTFWDYFRQHWQKNSGLRIDHLLLNPVLAPHLKNAGVDAWVRDKDHPSDHAPTWIEIAPRKSKK